MARIRIKAKALPSSDANSDRTSGDGPRIVHARRHRVAGTGAVLFGLAGWLAAAALLAIAVTRAVQAREEIRQIRASTPKEASRISAECQERIDAVDAKRKEVTEDYNEQIRLHEKLAYDIRSLESTLRTDIEPQATQAEQAHRKLSEEIKSIDDDASAANESAADLRKKLGRIEATVAEKRAQYERMEEAMKADFLAIREKRDARGLAHWYRTHRKTVFGPAAGTFAAERLYEVRRTQDALRLYEEIVRDFPDKTNPYLDHCRQRIERIQRNEPFEAANIKLMRYAPRSDETAASSPGE